MKLYRFKTLDDIILRILKIKAKEVIDIDVLIKQVANPIE